MNKNVSASSECANVNANDCENIFGSEKVEMSQ